MIEETKKHLSQLVEINRALANDLDVSRRLVAQLGRERDALLDQARELRSKCQNTVSCHEMEQMRYETETMRREQAQDRSRISVMVQHRNELLDDTEDAISMADAADDHLRALFAKYNEVEQERDYYRIQLVESNAAMDEIRHRLVRLPNEDFGFARGVPYTCS